MKLQSLWNRMRQVTLSLRVLPCPDVCRKGETRGEAIANVKEAIEGWLEVMEAKRLVDTQRMVEVVV